MYVLVTSFISIAGTIYLSITYRPLHEVRYYIGSMPLPHYYKEERPWGSFERFTENDVSTVKILHVAPGKRFSLQKHAKRAEFWRCIEGSGVATIDGVETPLSVGNEVLIPIGATHRLTAGNEGIAVLEIITGEYDENDIERLEDDFGRA